MQQAASMLRQHRRFLELHGEDCFVREFMEAIGHHEFGQALRPVDFGGWLEEAPPPARLEFWPRYWIEAVRAETRPENGVDERQGFAPGLSAGHLQTPASSVPGPQPMDTSSGDDRFSGLRASGPPQGWRIPRALLGLAVGGTLLLGMLPVDGRAQAERERDRQEPDALVHGHVLARETGERIEGVAVRILPADGRDGADRVTGEEGRFLFEAVAPGRYEVEFGHIGFGEIRDSVVFEAGSRVRLVVEMVPEAVELEPLVVQTTQRGRLVSAGFYRRRRAGLGRFLTRPEIEERDPYRVSDLFRSIPGVRVSPTSQGRQGLLTMRGGCVPDVYIDGIQTVSGRSVDEILQPVDVEAIEVYHGAEAPARFVHDGCGVVVVWTRNPSPGPEEGGSLWKRLGAAGLFVLSAFLLTR